MKIGDKLLQLGYINKKQLTEALKKQSQEKILYNKDLQLGKILLDDKYLTLDELTEALSMSIESEAKEESVMAKPTEIGESSKFTFDLKFLITMGAVIVSGCGIYFTMDSAIDELKSSNSPSRLEHDMIANEISSIKNAGNLDIITYKLEEYDKTFEELKEIVHEIYRDEHRESGLIDDLIETSLSNVDWSRLAEHYIEEIKATQGKE